MVFAWVDDPDGRRLVYRRIRDGRRDGQAGVGFGTIGLGLRSGEPSARRASPCRSLSGHHRHAGRDGVSPGRLIYEGKIVEVARRTPKGSRSAQCASRPFSTGRDVTRWHRFPNENLIAKWATRFGGRARSHLHSGQRDRRADHHRRTAIWATRQSHGGTVSPIMRTLRRRSPSGGRAFGFDVDYQQIAFEETERHT